LGKNATIACDDELEQVTSLFVTSKVRVQLGGSVDRRAGDEFEQGVRVQVRVQSGGWLFPVNPIRQMR
jgi:hypothetical protein